MNPFAEHLYIFLMFIPILSVHEAAHAWVAHLLGDDTAKDEGRLTLNPIVHIDLWGTILIPALNVLFSSSIGLIGWARPVPVNPGNLRHWRRDELLIALAGPVSNLLLAIPPVAIGMYCLTPDSPWQKLATTFAYVSIYLGIFNLLPIPPFDGWNIVRHVFRIPTSAIESLPWWFWIVVILLLINFPPVLAGMALGTEACLTGIHLLLGGGAAVVPA